MKDDKLVELADKRYRLMEEVSQGHLDYKEYIRAMDKLFVDKRELNKARKI